MFEKTEKALTNLVETATADVRDGIQEAKMIVVPAVAGMFARLAASAMMAKSKVEEVAKPEAAKPEAPKAAPAPELYSPEYEAANLAPKKRDYILAALAANSSLTNEIIGITINVSPAVVQVFRDNAEA
jgi:flagellar basal body-associated protein FliL